MGAVSSLEMLDAELRAQIEDQIVRPTVEGLISDGLPYRGFLYFGLMLTKDGPKVIEYNCRFGDPEAEAVLPMVRGDFAAYLFEAAKGALRPDLISFSEGWSICLVSASAGYPASSRSGDIISGLDQVSGARVFHSGTRRSAAGNYETAGGRVLVISASGATRAEAVAKVYAESDKVDFAGRQRRSDIGTRNF
jgi:phosphoribosylamine--glycine ligase